jgi:hypothetical protein
MSESVMRALGMTPRMPMMRKELDHDSIIEEQHGNYG